VGVADSVSVSPAATRQSEVDALEQRMIQLVNQDRANHGLAPLQHDPGLTAIAMGHSQDMVEHDFFAHESSRTGKMTDRYAAAGYLAVGSAENLAINSTIDAAEVALMNSPHHRDNILNRDLTHIGIGIVVTGAGNQRTYTITQNFSHPYQAQSPAQWQAQAQAQIAAARTTAGRPSMATDERLNAIATNMATIAAREGYDGERLKPMISAALREAGIDYRRYQFHYQTMYAPEHLHVPGSVAEPGTSGIGVGVAEAPPRVGSRLPQTVMMTLTISDR
jgi:uncharacterized protein YkwD